MTQALLDQQYMQRAIVLAQQGVGSTPPNPAVGCVIVQNGQIIGEGFHRQAGGPHAEVFALRQAADAAKGATAYVTLEPCSHFGRTPPCANALIAAGISRVVVAMTDPNPQVAGRGIAMLQQAGIAVTTGVCASDARQLNPEFLFKMEQQRPLVRLKLACSLDGAVALASGESQWLTGPQAREDVQLWRARSCAILSTAETVKTDKATLTVRSTAVNPLPNGLLRQPLRIILDRRCRLSGAEPLFQTGGDLLLIHCGEPTSWPELELPADAQFVCEQQQSTHLPTAAEATTTVAAVSRQVRRWRIGLDEVGQLDLPALFAKLRDEKINSIWVEAGARLATSLWQLQLVDELLVYQAPLLLGLGAQPLLRLPAPTSLAQASRWHWQQAVLLGPDVRLYAKLGNTATNDSADVGMPAQPSFAQG